MPDLLIAAGLFLLIVAIILLVLLFQKVAKTDSAGIAFRLDALERAQERIEHAVREEAARSREELSKSDREQRQELAEAFKTFGDSVAQRMSDGADMHKSQFDGFAGQLGAFARDSGERLDGIRAESAAGAKQLREEVVAMLKTLSEMIAQTMGDLASIQKAQLDAISSSMEKLSGSNEQKLETLRTAVEGKLQSIQDDNAKQLEQMRHTVEEKLEGTLEKRLGESFRQVSERLEQVHRGLGEMQTLATGVGDLKKVLTNVKTRGTWGEVQLGAMLEQVLNPDQFAANVSTKGNAERVEYAIRLPGASDDREETVWLPVDAKFPIEDYQRLIDAQDNGDVDGVESAGKQLEVRVRASARDICDKYLNPPATTDFGILFLPIEGLFAEVIRRPGLTEAIQRDCRVIIAGPTTLWSILNSLQMGFRTLAIQKRSSEVWNLLAAVKTEWTKYGDVLDMVHKKLNQASETIEKAKVRSRVIGRKLKDVQELPPGTNATLLEVGIEEDDGEDPIVS